jgi:hypothetical protein
MMMTTTSRLGLQKAKIIVKRILNKFKLIESPIKMLKQFEYPNDDKLVTDNQQNLQVVSTKKNSQIIGANWLINFKENQHSEHGEDGIIAKIFEILVPENKWVCEFGAHDPETISNTWRLIHKLGWSAVLIEADDGCYEKLEKYYQNSDHVHTIKSMISYEGSDILDNILEKTRCPTNIDLMIIDIDGNDYHVWEAIKTYQARVVLIEFNAAIPTEVQFVQNRDLSVNQGSSLAAMVELGNQKGYRLIAVTSWNAFFIKSEYYHLFFENEPALDTMYVYPAKQPIWLRVFQLYDGTIALASWDEMLWHNIKLTPVDYQVLPASYRFFSRELANKDYVLEKNSIKTPLLTVNEPLIKQISRMPGNILSSFAKNNFSRYGEDGILEKLVTTLGSSKLYCVDVGAYDGITFSRSRNLIATHKWKGLLIESDELILSQLKKNNLDFNANVHHQNYALSGKDSLDETLRSYQVPKDFSVLTLNVYGMEYYLWESLIEFTPDIVVVQFNPTIPNDVKFIQAKNFNVYQGCSLCALLELAHYKDYELVGVTLETAFFVKRKYTYRLFEKIGLQYATLDEIFSPALMHVFQLYDGTLSLQGLDRLLWNPMRIDEEKLQVVPKSLRKFHQFADKETKKKYYRID